jgi:DNA-binding NtrC family response regulator
MGLQEPAMRSLHILLVEEEPSFAEALLQAASARGHRVHLAPSLAAALRAIDAERFDVLLADIGLRERWHGRDVLVRLAGENPVPYVLTTGDTALDGEASWQEAPSLDRLFTRLEGDLGGRGDRRRAAL